MLAEVSTSPFQCGIYVATVCLVEVIGVKKVVVFLSQCSSECFEKARGQDLDCQ